MTETVTKYVIRAEQIITALRGAGEAPSEGLMMAMVVRVTGEVQAVHTDGDAWFSGHDAGRVQGKVEKFRGFKRLRPSRRKGERVLRAQVVPKKMTGPVEMVCWRCREKGHRRDDCTEKVWCSFCKSRGHTDKACTKKERERSARCACVQDGIVEQVVNQMAPREPREEKTTPSGHKQKMPASQGNGCRSIERD